MPADDCALELRDVELHWEEGGTWSGGAKVVLNFSHKYTIGAGFGIKNGDFDFLRGSISGLNVDIARGYGSSAAVHPSIARRWPAT